MSDAISNAWDTLKEAMRDLDYAWSWHCNLAVPIMDAIGCTHEQADKAAAHLMQHLWACDITTHPHYEYGKSGAQAYAEIRMAANEPVWKGGYDEASWRGRYAEAMMRAGLKPYEAECWALNAWEASPEDADPDDTASDDMAYSAEGPA